MRPGPPLLSENGNTVTDHLTAQIDDLDRELIRELEINALQTNVILAKKLKVNRNTVKTRFEKLLEERVIRILPIEDPFARGFRTQVHMGLNTLPSQVDVVAKKDDQKIAIEIETGKSNYLRNIRQDMLAKYDQILVVTTDKTAYEKVEKDLAIAGLLIPKKVKLILRDDSTFWMQPHKSPD
jgi:DNA-binding Lrp family transcriptional regulator